MKIIRGNIWDWWEHGYLVIPTNLCIRRDGRLVMGAGLARQARDKIKDLDLKWAQHFKDSNKLLIDDEYKLIAFPTKTHWKLDSDLKLIDEGFKLLYKNLRNQLKDQNVYCPKVGSGLGNLDFHFQIKPKLRKFKNFRNFNIVL